MTDYLVFRLYAPLASWGAPAVGQHRPSQEYPGKAAIIGLLGAALGIRRDDIERQQQLLDSVKVAVKQYTAGSLLSDYHTTQVPSARSKVSYATRKDELNALPRKIINTILSSREYRCDGYWVVAIRSKDSAAYSLECLRDALEKPVFVLYLGRKSCPVAAPLVPHIVSAETLQNALDTSFETTGIDHPGSVFFDKVVVHDREAMRSPGHAVYAWEGDINDLTGDAEGVTASDTWDQPVADRRKWQFESRTEYQRAGQVEQENG